MCGFGTFELFGADTINFLTNELRDRNVNALQLSYQNSQRGEFDFSGITFNYPEELAPHHQPYGHQISVGR